MPVRGDSTRRRLQSHLPHFGCARHSRRAATCGHIGLFHSSYAFLVLLIGYIVLAIGCLFRRA
jgi:hypothetical protein